MNAPLAWLQAEQQPHRACLLCQHSRTVEGQRCCGCPEVAGRQRMVPVLEARGRTGPCGPEAHYLDFPGLQA